jgi:sugar/nucleoside kinase (ribokinase family)
MPPRFVAIGELMLDVSAHELVPGGVVHAPIRVRAGGSPVTAALAAAVEGVDSSVVGRVGDDVAGRAVREALVAAGVEPLLQVDPVLPTGTFFQGGIGTIVTDRGANVALDPGTVSADAILVSGYYVFQAGGDPLERLAAEWLAVDAGSPRLVRLDAIERANALLADEEELAAVGGDVGALAKRFRLLCVKRGPDGAAAYLDGSKEERTPPTRAGGVHAGGGDAFAGSLLASLLLGRDLGEALERACAAGMREVAGDTLPS